MMPRGIAVLAFMVATSFSCQTARSGPGLRPWTMVGERLLRTADTPTPAPHKEVPPVLLPAHSDGFTGGGACWGTEMPASCRPSRNRRRSSRSTAHCDAGSVSTTSRRVVP